MSVIVAKSAYVYTTTSIQATTFNIPAISVVESIAPGDINRVVDLVDINQWYAIKWHIFITTGTGSLTTSYEIFANCVNKTTISNTVYGILGDREFFQDPIIAIIDGNITLQLSNHTVEINNVYITRFAIPINKQLLNTSPQITISNRTAIVASGNTNVIDWISNPADIASKWYITVTNAIGDRSISQICGIQYNGTSTDLIYGWVGDSSLTYSLSTALDIQLGLGLQLIFTNNDIVSYRVDITRVPIQTTSLTTFPPLSSLIVSGLNIWNPDSVVVSAGATTAIDTTVDLPNHQGVKWFIVVVENSTHKSTAFEIIATQSNFTSTHNTVYGFVGDYLSLDIVTNIVDSNMVLYLTNNQHNSVTANIIRIPISL